MFSLLSPFTLWLGAALAVPLMIHFLGRQRLKRQPFPSLLLVQERFSKSMHRHRLKNLLLLIIRTLLILCLLLALSNPILDPNKSAGNSGNASAGKTDNSIALIHNGIYGSLLPSGSDVSGPQALETQWLRVRALDSAEGVHTQTIPVIVDGPGPKAVSQRFGDMVQAVERSLTAIRDKPGKWQLHLPVFDWLELNLVQARLLQALKENPGLSIVLTDFGVTATNVRAFTELRASLSPESPTVKLNAILNPAAAATNEKVQVFLNATLFQAAAPEGGRVEVTLPLGSGPRTLGRVSLPKSGFAAPDLFFCFPEAGEWTLGHAGSTLASLTSLGRETYFRRIVHVASSKDLPWTSGPTSGKRTSLGTPANGMRLIYLAAERNVQANAYARAVEFVKLGGHLIIGVGQESDIAMLNRFLLQPLRLGRLGNLIDAPATVTVTANREGLSRLGGLPGDLGKLGTVRKRFDFSPDSGVVLLLSQGRTGAPVLVARDFHLGQVLLWTTNIDDLGWTDLGVSPAVPLLHQAFQESQDGNRTTNLAVASDSIYTVVLAGSVLPAGASAASGGRAEVRDPEGRRFTRVKYEGGLGTSGVDKVRLRIGPFDNLGIYNIIYGKDTLAFAVNLASRMDASGRPQPGSGDTWTEANENAKQEVLEKFKPVSGRLSVVGLKEPAGVKASSLRLWPAFILAAILLLLLEGLISSTLSLRRKRP